MSDRKWELVTMVNDPIQAEILKGLLEAQGVMIHIVREGYQAAYGIANQPSVHIEDPGPQRPDGRSPPGDQGLQRREI